MSSVRTLQLMMNAHLLSTQLRIKFAYVYGSSVETLQLMMNAHLLSTQGLLTNGNHSIYTEVTNRGHPGHTHLTPHTAPLLWPHFTSQLTMKQSQIANCKYTHLPQCSFVMADGLPQRSWMRRRDCCKCGLLRETQCRVSY